MAADKPTHLRASLMRTTYAKVNFSHYLLSFQTNDASEIQTIFTPAQEFTVFQNIIEGLETNSAIHRSLRVIKIINNGLPPINVYCIQGGYKPTIVILIPCHERR